ncbi:MAG: PadR family transcriptional regulator [Gemmatimonadetes bacterium]|nr:PadR family transcriptional regulator [Gemmatimonadota bacterium]
MGASRGRPAVDELLPLKPVWFHVLLALRAGEAHGFEIRERVEERTQGAVRLWPVTLYGTIRRLEEAALIEALEGEDDPDDDARRRYYRLTAFGRHVLLAEANRLEALVRAARGVRPLGEA